MYKEARVAAASPSFLPFPFLPCLRSSFLRSSFVCLSSNTDLRPGGRRSVLLSSQQGRHPLIC